MNLVLLILDPHFGENLEQLPRNTPVWMVDSPRNRAALNSLGTACGPVAVFSLRDNETAMDVFQRIVESLDQHHNEFAQHPPYDTLDVYGLPADADMLDSVKDFGFVLQVKKPDAMRFLKAGTEELPTVPT